MPLDLNNSNCRGWIPNQAFAPDYQLFACVRTGRNKLNLGKPNREYYLIQEKLRRLLIGRPSFSTDISENLLSSNLELATWNFWLGIREFLRLISLCNYPQLPGNLNQLTSFLRTSFFSKTGQTSDFYLQEKFLRKGFSFILLLSGLIG